MSLPVLPTSIIDGDVHARTVERFRAQRISLPTFAELADPATMSAARRSALVGVDADVADPANLWRVHWFNGADRHGLVDVPEHLVLPPALTGVEAPIIVVLGRLFPMIRAHKVLAAYACLVPHVVTGGFDPTTQRAVWPSTGNYARGGVAISTLMGCRGVAVLPEGMSQERFDWLARWTTDEGDVIRTPGTESNVKEIYDACHRLAADPTNRIFNQFSEYANHLGHLVVTGPALARTFEAVRAAGGRDLRLAGFTSATGSAGTIAAGDHLKDVYGTRIVAVEALECPTMLRNGYGAHNIQGIGDKHIPLIHNVMNTDAVVAVSDRATDGLDAVFNTDAGRRYLVDRLGVAPALVDRLDALGFSSICNILASIRMAKRWGLGPDDAIVTVATDGAELYDSERAKYLERQHGDGFDATDAAAIVGEHLRGADTADLIDCPAEDRERIFNLGYFTWVEQQGISLEHFDARRRQSFWWALRPAVAAWDELITEFNGRTGMVAGT
ncbi:MAG: pyridoxal-phosphate dependent enzyme [Acidimicrobiales bacterium]|nr:pyridoxal-phosphate dependent enzyme [Acidimicrobiales bacterium]